MKLLLMMQGRSYLREAIASFLRTEDPSIDVITAERAEDLDDLSGVNAATVDLVLLHVGLHPADSDSVQEFIASVRSRIPTKPVVLLGDITDDDQSKLALDQGINGYIPAGTPAAIIKHVLPIIANGGVYAPPFVFGRPGSSTAQAPGFAEENPPQFNNGLRASVPSDMAQGFTRREVEVLTLLGEGLPNKLIAHRLDLKEGTVKVHVRHIMKKLDVTSRTQAALFAQRHLSGVNVTPPVTGSRAISAKWPNGIPPSA